MFAFVPSETRLAGADPWDDGVAAQRRQWGFWCHPGAGGRDGSEASVPQILNLRALQP